MVKKEPKDEDAKESFSTFQEFFENYYELEYPLVSKKSQSTEIDQNSIPEKLPLSKSLKILSKILASLHSESTNAQTICVKYLKSCSKKLIKRLKLSAPDEKLSKNLTTFFLSSKQLLSFNFSPELIPNVIEAITSVLKAAPAVYQTLDYTRLLCRLSLIKGNERYLAKIFKTTSDAKHSFFIIVCTVVNEISKLEDNLEAILAEINSILNEMSVKRREKLVNGLIRVLKNFVKSQKDGLTTNYFNTLILFTKLALISTSPVGLPELVNASFKYLLVTNGAMYYPLKLQLLQKITAIEIQFNLYTPGVIPHLYEILISIISFKRPKSLRVTKVSFEYKISVTKEEASSEVYRNKLIDLAFEILSAHCAYLQKIAPLSLQPLKAFLQSLLEFPLVDNYLSKLNHTIKQLKI